MPSAEASTATFTHEELAHLRRLRRAFLRQHGIARRDELQDGH
jgi:hypothetical protein